MRPPTFRRLGALLACHNRRTSTLACLAALFAQKGTDDVDLQVILLDDGSTDGTAEAVRGRFPAVEVLHGDGELFWGGGMRRAFAVGLARSLDAYLWLNDDTLLDPGALASLLETLARKIHQPSAAASYLPESTASEPGLASQQTASMPASQDSDSSLYLQASTAPRNEVAAFSGLGPLAAGHGRPVVVVGSTRDPDTGRITYGGYRRLGPLPFLRRLKPTKEPRPCATMNGNCVLIPRAVACRIGNLDPAFSHLRGDLDYGLRATGEGCEIWLAPGTCGTCVAHPVGTEWRDPGLTLRERLSTLQGPKYALAEKKHFVQRHFPALGFLSIMAVYPRLVTSHLKGLWRRSP